MPAWPAILLATAALLAAEAPPPFPADPAQPLERTCFQTGGPWTSAGKALPVKQDSHSLALAVEGVAGTPAIVLLFAPQPPRAVTLAGRPCEKCEYSAPERLLWIRFANESAPRELVIEF